MDLKSVAKEIRTILKANFSDIKFSVKCHQFSQGEAVVIAWIDGPAKNEVEPLVKTYGDGYSRYIRISRRTSVSDAPENIANWVETVAVPDSKVQESVTLADERLTKLVELQELLISKVEEVNQLKLKIAELQVETDTVKYSQQQLAAFPVAVTPQSEETPEPAKEVSEPLKTEESKQQEPVTTNMTIDTLEKVFRSTPYYLDFNQLRRLAKGKSIIVKGRTREAYVNQIKAALAN